MPVKFARETLKGSTKTQGDFHLSHLFTVEIDGVTVGGINNVSGLEDEHETVEYQDSDDHLTRFRPGRQKKGQITVTRDWSSTTEFFDWFKTVLDGKVARKSISIVYKNDKGEEASRINLYDTWPCAWKIQGLNSKSSGHAQETLSIIFERMDFKVG